MTTFRKRRLEVVIVALIAAGLLILVGIWLALVDSFVVIRGSRATGIATILGMTALSTGGIAIALARRVLSQDRFAIGCVAGAALITVAATGSLGVWLIAVPASVLAGASLILGNVAPRAYVPRVPHTRDSLRSAMG